MEDSGEGVARRFSGWMEGAGFWVASGGIALYVIGMKTVMEVLNAATDYLAKRSVESPRRNAEYLVAHVLGCKRLDLYLEFDRPLGEAVLAPLRELLRRRGQRVPLQHLLGTVEFHGRVFASDARALIPRPETEVLLEAILAEPLGEEFRFLDVGTGSGVIALTLACERPKSHGVAVDLSPEALSLARENATRHEVGEDRLMFKEGNLFSTVEGQFHLVVANLPYIASGEIPGLAAEVRQDPHLALDGGPEGTELIVRLIDEARPFLAPGALLALEIGDDQSAFLHEELREKNYRDIRAREDYQGALRFLFAVYG